MQGSCNKEVFVKDGLTQDTSNGWTRFYFPLALFDCTGAVKIPDLNRIQWENRGPGTNGICFKDLRIIPQDDSVASAGR